MICSNCQTSNPEGAKFCMNCGYSLSLNCPNCDTQLPAGVKFCFNCGYQHISDQSETQHPSIYQERFRQYMPQELASKLETARTNSSLEGERRIVTILFCDVAGSTSLAESLDPEEWTEVMNKAFEYLIKPVYKFEGIVARLMGDAILAFFGAPIAHEDDPERAVLAGLDILRGIQEFRQETHRHYGLDFNVRIGINTGLVVVGTVGTDLRVEYTAMGDAVNLAARMEQTAQPGTVQIAEDTFKLVASLFVTEPLGGIEVKGKQEPVRAYRVLHRQEGVIKSRGIEGLQSPIVGRNHEIHLFQDRLKELIDGRGHIISVIGEAGLGKSRLLAEIKKMVIGEKSTTNNGQQEPFSSVIGHSSLLWLEGRSLSYEASKPYAPFIDLFKHFIDLDIDLPDKEKYNQLTARMAEVFPERASEMAPFIATMLGLNLTDEELERVRYIEPPQLRERIFNAVYELVAHAAQQQPVVLVFEDLHWVDLTSLELIQHLVPLAERAMLMMIALFRPHPQDISWQFHEIARRDFNHIYAEIILSPLDEVSSRELVSNLLHVEDLPEKVRALILRKAEGNPFFVEEVIRSLLDAKLVVRENSHWRATREIKTISVPDTLTGVITARLDRLDEASKRLTQTASVIGREFLFDILSDVYENIPVLEDSLLNLQRRELIWEKSRLPKRFYSFKHVLTQETAYASLLLSKRRELHRRVAERLEMVDPQSVNDIARHFLEAHDEKRALPYLIEAGDRAARAYSTQEAISYFKEALKVLNDVQNLDLARRAFEGLGRALTFANNIPATVENYQNMYKYAGKRNDIPMQVSALNKLSDIVAMRLGQFPEAEIFLLDAENMARNYKDLPGLAEMFMVRCGLCIAKGDFDGAVNYLSESVQIGNELNLKEQMALGLTHIANTQIYMTRFEEAWKTAQEARKITEEVGNQEHLAEILTYSVPLYHLRNGNIVEARNAVEEGMLIATQIGALFPKCYGAFTLGLLAGMAGRYEEAISYQELFLEVSREGNFVFFEAMPLCILGSLYLEISRKYLDRTLKLHNEALKLLENPAGMMGGGICWVEIGFCYLTVGDLEQAKQYFEQGLNTPTPQMLLLQPRYLVGLALVALGQANLDEAESFVHQARHFIEERAMRDHYPLVELTEGQVKASRGELQQALQYFTRAEEQALAMEMRPTVRKARIEAAKVLLKMGLEAEAETKFWAAREMLEEMATFFQSEELRALYMENEPVDRN